MKKQILLLALLLLCTSPSFAYDFEVNGVYYERLGGDSVKLVDYKSSASTFSIPITVSVLDYNNTRITYRVTRIDNYAFSNCSHLTTVIIGSHVNRIGEGVFCDCSSLTDITIRANVRSIYRKMFSGCSKLSKIIIPDNINYIGPYAFSDCVNLTEVTIPNSVTDIGGYAFQGCSSISEITLPNRIKTISSYIFSGCSALSKIAIPDSVTYIGSYAFSDCVSLTEVTIPNSVTDIGEHAFYGCSSLSEITIPSGVTRIDKEVFLSCSNLRKITWNAKKCTSTTPFYDITSQITSFTFGNDVNTIPASLCKNMEKLTAVTIPINVIELDYRAFEGCSNITEITWNAKRCPSASFSEIASQITSFTFGNEVEFIPSSVCYKMNNLTAITIPNSVTEIGPGAFAKCSSISKIIIPNNVTELSDNLFSDCSSITRITIPTGVTKIGFAAFRNCSNLSEIIIPSNVTYIEIDAFKGCSSLVEITIPNSVTYIADAFEGCSSLTRIIWNATECSTYASSFSAPYQITSFTFGNNVEYIPAYLCSRMINLTDITIPNSVTYIGDYAFQLCSSLSKIVCNTIAPPTIFKNTFLNINRSIPLWVPEESIEAYKAAAYWKEFTNIQGITENLTDLFTPTSSENPPIRKVLENGTIYIISNEETYMIDGRKVN